MKDVSKKNLHAATAGTYYWLLITFHRRELPTGQAALVRYDIIPAALNVGLRLMP